MKICVSTSERYYHLLPVFAYLFQKYWSKDQSVEIVGYSDLKCLLPENFTFHSMGKQGPVSEWSTDLRKYFQSIPEQWFIWLMEDCLLRRVNVTEVNEIYKGLCKSDYRIGRYDLTNDVQKRPHKVVNGAVRADINTNYRLSTQASIWNKKFLLQYLTDGLNPWQMEKQDTGDDGWHIMGSLIPPLKVNEGVRKHNPHELDLNGFSVEDVAHIKTLL